MCPSTRAFLYDFRGRAGNTRIGRSIRRCIVQDQEENVRFVFDGDRAVIQESQISELFRSQAAHATPLRLWLLLVTEFTLLDYLVK